MPFEHFWCIQDQGGQKPKNSDLASSPSLLWAGIAEDELPRSLQNGMILLFLFSSPYVFTCHCKMNGLILNDLVVMTSMNLEWLSGTCSFYKVKQKRVLIGCKSNPCTIQTRRYIWKRQLQRFVFFFFPPNMLSTFLLLKSTLLFQ